MTGPAGTPRIGRTLGVAAQLVAAIVVTAVLLAVGELVAGVFVVPDSRRGFLEHPGEDFVATTLNVLDIAPEMNPSPLVKDLFVLWRNKPLARKTQPINPRVYGREETWTIAIDSEGYRGPERPYRNERDGVYRIVCVGDSVTFGFNVDQEAAYPRRLEAALHERYPGRRIEVVNTAVPGWSWVQGLRFLEAEGLGLHPDLVIAAHGTNDQFFLARVTDRERLPAARKPAPELMPPSFLQRTNTYRALSRLAGAVRKRSPSRGCRIEMRETHVCHRDPLADIATTVGEMYRLVHATGADFLALNMDFTETAAVNGLRQAVEAEHIPFVDFVERFRTLRTAEEGARALRLGLAPGGPAGDAAPNRPHRVLFRVVVASPAPAVSVKGGAYFRTDFTFAQSLADDGTHGDEVAGDGVFSGAVDVPPDVGAVEYKFWLADTAEFTPLPPLQSSVGTRLLKLDRDAIAPVAEFADNFLMAERTHPNARGQETIAAGLMERLEQVPSFVAWRGGAAGGARP